MVVLSITQGGSRTYKKGSYFYVYHRVAVSRITQSGNCTCNTEYLFYVKHRVAVLSIMHFAVFRIKHFGNCA